MGIDMGDGPDSLDGKRLHREMQHECGALTTWHCHPKGGAVLGADFNFNLPWIYPSGCVEKAVDAAGVIKDFKCWVFGIATANCQNCDECSGSNILFVWFFFSPLYSIRGLCVLLWSARKDRPRGYKLAGSGSYALINGYYDTDTEVSQTELRIGYGKPRHRFGCIYLYRDMIFLPKHFCVRAEPSWQFLR